MTAVSLSNSKLLKLLLFNPMLHQNASRRRTVSLNRNTNVPPWSFPKRIVTTPNIVHDTENEIWNLRYGIYRESLNEVKMSPLNLAVIQHDGDIIRDLLIAGADPGFKDVRGKNAFQALAHAFESLHTENWSPGTAAVPTQGQDQYEECKDQEHTTSSVPLSSPKLSARMKIVVELLYDFSNDNHKVDLMNVLENFGDDVVNSFTRRLAGERENVNKLHEYDEYHEQDVLCQPKRKQEHAPTSRIDTHTTAENRKATLFHHVKAPSTFLIQNRGYVPKGDPNFKGRIYNKRRESRSTSSILLPNWYSPKG